MAGNKATAIVRGSNTVNVQDTINHVNAFFNKTP